MEKEAGTPDSSGQLEAYAQEVYDTYDDDWPFEVDPIAEDSFVQVVVARTRGKERCPRPSSALIAAG
jgi:hypothetical protein